MESAGLRRRNNDQTHMAAEVPEDHTAPHSLIEDGNDLQPAVFTIDLSQPPRRRYREIAQAYKSEINALQGLFDEITEEMRLSPKMARSFAKLFLRRLYSTEETEELRGVSDVTGIEMYLLVAYNVLLDLFMGCTSGGVKIHDEVKGPKMLHFRTLDWGMDALRKVIVQLDFVKQAHGPVIASSITYAGYVGVLTGVRRGLSLSLNFRPCHDNSTRLNNFRFYLNHILVLLGFRQSISSLLRQCLLPSAYSVSQYHILGTTLAEIEQRFPSVVTTAAYIILSDGDRTVVLEKDRAKAVNIQASDFVCATNHDEADESVQAANHPQDNNAALQVTGMDSIVEESIDRKGVMHDLWSKSMQHGSQVKRNRGKQAQRGVTTGDVVKWVNTYPITNEETHFATIMDPAMGKFIWTARYISPLLEDQ